MKKIDLLAATALSLMIATPAFAQDSTTNNPDTTRLGEESQDAQIVVTATKRATTLVDTPISVAVTDGDTIEDAQVRDLLDLQTLVPSLRVSLLQSSANTSFIVRGFGNGANNAGIEPSVGVFVDGVYRSRSAAQIADLPNVQRVEVLRGPQSTLFGKNASAGIISIVTAPPSFDFGGNVEASYGNYNAVVLKGYVTGPISDTIAVSLGANYNRRDGYGYDAARDDEDPNNRNRYGVRGQLLFEPNADLSVRIIGDYDHIDEQCCIVGNLINGPTGGAVAALGGNVGEGRIFDYVTYTNKPSSNLIKNYGVSGEINYQHEGVTLTSITAYRGVRLDTDQDSDFTSADLIAGNANRTDIDTFTQELRLTTDFDGPVNVLIGGFYFNEKINVEDDIYFGDDFRGYANLLIAGQTGGTVTVPGLEAQLAPFGVTPGSFFAPGQGLFDRFDYKDESFSLFGQLDFEVTDKLTFTVGVNYTNDTKNVVSDVTSTDVFSSLDFVGIGNALITQQGIATTVGQLLSLGRLATPAEVAGFATANPAGFAQVQAGAQAYANANQSNPAVNPLLGLQQFQFLPPFLNFPNAVEDGRTHDENVSYTLRLAYAFTPRINGYVTYATGFKASSFNLSRDSRPLAADLPAIRGAGLAVPNLASGSRFANPENAKVIEAGLKGQFTFGAFNLAVFKQTLTGFQSNVFTGTGFALANADKQSTTGFELDGTLTPVQGLNLSGAVTYLDAKYDSFPNSSVGDLSGLRPAGIPEWSFTVGGAYTFDLSGGTTLLVRADYNWESEVDVIDGDPRFKRQVQNLSAAAVLGLTNGIEVSVWGRNLTNAQYLLTAFPTPAQPGSYSGYPSQPRTYGITGRMKF